jgi:hypothetical protein
VRRRNGAAPGTDRAVAGGRKITTPFGKRRSSSRHRPEKQAQFRRTDGKVALGTVKLGDGLVDVHLPLRGKVGVEAFDANDRSLGVYPNRTTATDAVSAATGETIKAKAVT